MAHEHPPSAKDASPASAMSLDANRKRPDVGPASRASQSARPEADAGGPARTPRPSPDLLATASHDLRNELNGMVSFAKLIELELGRAERNDRVLGYARRIEHAGARMSRLIGDLVDMTRIECGELVLALEREDAVQVLIETTETFQSEAAERGIELDVELGEPKLLVSLDRGRIVRVLGHLIELLLDATPSGGVVVARVEPTSGGGARFSIAGPAAGEAYPRLAAMFARADSRGTCGPGEKDERHTAGLAPFLCKAIVEVHGGELRVEGSEDDRQGGTALAFTLPA